jgi:GntR family transcriptional regulator
MALDLVRGSAVADPTNQPWPGGTLAELWSLGIEEFDKVIEWVSTRTPIVDERVDLELPTGKVIVIDRIFVAGGKPVEYSKVVLPADGARLRFTTAL